MEAEALLSMPDFERRMDAYLTAEQRGRWGRGGISGYYWYLYALVSIIKPKKVVELGR